MKKLYLGFSLLLFIVLSTANILFAQDKNERLVANLRKKLNDCTINNKQLTEENLSLHESNKRFMNWVINLRDSLNQQISNNATLTNQNSKLEDQKGQLENKLTSTSTELSTAQKNIEMLKYDLALEKNNEIVRIYNQPLAKVKESIIDRLSDESLGFQFDEDDSKGLVKINKAFDGNTEAWWVFDKTIDVLLEMKIQLKPHQYDSNKTLLFASTSLLEKVRFSNKQYEPQDDLDKAKLYQEKAIRLLESKLKL
ncbi:MAG: hypothetical protein MUF45_05060 [Spirosomaceae bacterium]|jgi:hypothetical protein|nr:hypothetical protein [Spirosomataceae bacterium]